MKYSIQELRLLSFVLRCFDNGQYSTVIADDEASSDGSSSEDGMPTAPAKPQIKNGAYCLTLTEMQVGAIENLNSHLSTGDYNSKGLRKAIDQLLEALYMPDNTDDMLSNVFVSPVIAMVCLTALAPEGGFLHPRLTTGKLVALQCAVRLCIYFFAVKGWRQTKKGAEKTSDWFEWVPSIQLCAQCPSLTTTTP